MTAEAFIAMLPYLAVALWLLAMLVWLAVRFVRWLRCEPYQPPDVPAGQRSDERKGQA